MDLWTYITGSLLFRPPLGWPGTVLVVAGGAAGIVWAARRDRRSVGVGVWWWLVGLRTMGVAGLLGILAGPGVYVDQDSAGRQVPVDVLADTSASMGRCDVRGGPTRWETVTQRWLDPGFLDELREAGATIGVYGFDANTRMLRAEDPRTLLPDGDQTDLISAIADRSRPGTGVVVVLSDGRDTGRATEQAKLDRLEGMRWPVVTVGVGRESHEPDIAVSAWADADTLLEHQSTTIQVAVTLRGMGDRDVDVRLLSQGKVIQSKRIRHGDNPGEQPAFEITPQRGPGPGPWTVGYEVVAESVTDDAGEQPAEATTDNNRRWVFVRVTADKIKVLLLDGQPYWDSKFVARVLREDPQILLHAVYGLGPGRTVSTVSEGLTQPGGDGDDPIGQTEWTIDRLSGFDVVILGRRCERFFGGERAARLVEYVRDRGGNLVFLGGQPFDGSTESGRLAQKTIEVIEPVRWGRGTLQDLSLEATAAGRQNPVTRFEQLGGADAVISRLGGMVAAKQIAAEKPAAVVLLRQAGRADLDTEGTPPDPIAAVAYQNVGAGRVFAQLGDGLWRWAMLPEDQDDMDQAYGVFWSRAVRWLALGGDFIPGQSFSITTDRLCVLPGQPLNIETSARDVARSQLQWRLAWVRPDGTTELVELDRASERALKARATIRPDAPGVHEFTLQTRTELGDVADPGGPGWTGRAGVNVAVYDPSIESMDSSANPGLLARISAATGGLALAVDEMDRLVEFVRGVHAAGGSGKRWEYRFAHRWSFAVLLVIFTAQWTVRRRAGLV